MGKIFISLLNWINFQDCIKCVKSLEKLSSPEITILIRDNASPNNSVQKLKEALPNYPIYGSKHNNGYAAGHLANWEIAKKEGADFFWILNCDLIVSYNSLDAFLDAYKRNGEHIYGSISLQPENPNLIDFGGGIQPITNQEPFTYNLWEGKSYRDYSQIYPQEREIQSVEGSSMFLPASLIHKYGFMHTDFFMYAEENDYAYRLRKKGVKSILVTNSTVIHYSASSFKGENKLYLVSAYYRRRNFMRFLKTHYNWNSMNILNHPDSFLSKVKFLTKYYLSPSFRRKNEKQFIYLKGSLDAVFERAGKTIKPEKFI
ncbi:glycosyltransferase family 2 protein [Flammeovirgaceae bacterium SG7u.111]|nr:glycosyltransferase family 2 protein [Flammeovirgaceae bacterium SG7u.132]WPO34977.1 glycosyltransferase family 2 protein [Flammeovirgaceae bacterium SG7u.111]